MVCLALARGLSAQNLVENPSFELYETCPDALGTFDHDVREWSTPTQGTTDYFNTCSKVMGAPENFNGIQHPKFGDAYAGLYFYAPADYREYIQVPLKKTLRKGRAYLLDFYISLAEDSDFAIKDFGIVFSQNAVAVPTKKTLSKRHLYTIKRNKIHLFEVNHPRFHENKSDWLRVKREFVAKGFERYLILGNLRSNARTNTIQTRRKESKKGAYYYIDMVSLYAEHPEEQRDEKLQSDTLYVFEAIRFDYDVFQLSKTAELELKQVYETLVQHPELFIEIHGHTDLAGTDTYNRILSKRRADALADYLIQLGLAKNRIASFGHGSSKPRATNETVAGRASNRRAEFLFRNK